MQSPQELDRLYVHRDLSAGVLVDKGDRELGEAVPEVLEVLLARVLHGAGDYARVEKHIDYRADPRDLN